MRIFKKLLIFLIFFLIGLLIAKSKIIPLSEISLFQVYNKYFYENIDTVSTDNIEKVTEEVNSKLIEGKIYVPEYWKYGRNIDTNDYLEGYLPNIRSFKEYFELDNNIKYGLNPYTNTYSLEDIFNQLNKDSIFYNVRGIENESTFFAWDNSKCKSLYSERVNSNIFVCDNWVNWIKLDIEDKEFAFVNCTLGGKVGYCIFEDYVKTYYEINRYGESRCFGESELLCDYEKYLNKISIN